MNKNIQSDLLRILNISQRYYILCFEVCIEIFVYLNVMISDKTIKLWRVSERDKKVEGYNLREEDGNVKDPNTISQLRVS